ncbi:winged helix-turn-helix domain-containing protein [Acidocella aminolytica]|jgi:molybdate transport system regulatory protein|nr:winged helix-turn-helix domain-containing protein [Acidocella aminolytica]SHE83719.1 molybdate transport system regulatory protein [Acidocella aminolytica 101 = DSM 11237]
MFMKTYRTARVTVKSGPCLNETMAEDQTLKLRLRLNSAQGVVMGPGRAELLASIAETGSIAAAGRRMGMSYKRAWNLVESLNNSFTAPLVETAKGGASHGGARLTALGEELLAAYHALESAALHAGADALKRFDAVLAVPPTRNPR